MKDEEYYKLFGYISLLQKAPPNGRYNHTVANKILGLKLSIKLGHYITPEYEDSIKVLIRKLYSGG